MSADVTVVVGTLDLYKDVWEPLCAGIAKYWPDCPWPVKFITNELDPPCGEAVKVGKDSGPLGNGSWSARIRRGLRQVKEDVVLWLTEDAWLTAPLDTKTLTTFSRYVQQGKLDYIRLFPGWNLDQAKGPFPDDLRLLIFTRKSPYRCSLKPAFWRRKVFSKLLKAGESAWDFERLASKRSRTLGDRFAAVADWGYFPHAVPDDPTGPWAKTPVVKGRWTTAAKRYAELEGLEIDFSVHPVGRIIDDKLRKVDWVLP